MSQRYQQMDCDSITEKRALWEGFVKLQWLPRLLCRVGKRLCARYQAAQGI